MQRRKVVHASRVCLDSTYSNYFTVSQVSYINFARTHIVFSLIKLRVGIRITKNSCVMADENRWKPRGDEEDEEEEEEEVDEAVSKSITGL